MNIRRSPAVLLPRCCRTGAEPCGRALLWGRRESSAQFAAKVRHVTVMTEAWAPELSPCTKIATAVCGLERRMGYGDGTPGLPPVIWRHQSRIARPWRKAIMGQAS